MAPKGGESSTRPTTKVVRTAAAERSRRARHGANADEVPRRLSDPERLLRQDGRGRRPRRAPASQRSQSGRSEAPPASEDPQRPGSSGGAVNEPQPGSRQPSGGRSRQASGGEQIQQSPGNGQHPPSRQSSDARNQQTPRSRRDQQTQTSPRQSPTNQQQPIQQHQGTDGQTEPNQPPIGAQGLQPPDQPVRQSPAGPATGTNGTQQEVPGGLNNEQQHAGAGKDSKQREGERDGELKGAGKRGRDSDGQDQGPSKRQKDAGEGGKEGEQTNARSGPANNSCQELERLLRECRARGEADVLVGFGNPVTYGGDLDREDVIRAITAVSERIMTTNGRHRYSVMDGDSLLLINTVAAAPWHRLTRKRHEALIPWTTMQGRQGHTSLFILQPQPDGNTMLHRDSARNEHSHRGQSQVLATLIRTNVHGAQWHGDQPVGNQPAAVEDDTTPQLLRWTCGIHTIFNAWAYALGLGLAVAPMQQRYGEFIQRGMEIIRLAVRGHMTSRTIWAFFDCFGFILPGQNVSADRHFENTLQLMNNPALVDYAARQRIQEDLDDLRQQPDFPPELPEDVDNALLVLGNPYTPNTTGQGLIDMLKQIQAEELAIQQQFQNAAGPQAPTSEPIDPTSPADTPRSPPDDLEPSSAGEESPPLVGLGISNIHDRLDNPTVIESPRSPPMDEAAEQAYYEELATANRRANVQAILDRARASADAGEPEEWPRDTPDCSRPPPPPSPSPPPYVRTSPDYDNPVPPHRTPTPRTSPSLEEHAAAKAAADAAQVPRDAGLADPTSDDGDTAEQLREGGNEDARVEPEKGGSNGDVGFEDEELDYGDGDEFDAIYYN